MTVAQDHAVLVGPEWALVSVLPDGDAPADVASRGLVFTFVDAGDSLVMIQNRCMTNRVDVSSRGMLLFSRPFVSMLIVSCPRLARPQQHFVYGRMLTGAVGFAVSGSRLVLRKASTGELRLES